MAAVVEAVEVVEVEAEAAAEGWRRRRAGARRRIHPRLHRVVPSRVVGVDRKRVARPAGQARKGVARARPARDERAVSVTAVPGHPHVVARGAPSELDGGLGHLAGDKARRLRRGRGVRAGARRSAPRGLARAVAGGVVGVDRKRVARPAGEAGERVRRPRRRARGHQARVDPVPEDADIVERRAPGERQRRVGCARYRERRRARRRGRVGAGARLRRKRRLRGAPASLVSGVDLDEIGGSAREPAECGGVRADALHKTVVAVDPVLADAVHTSPLDSERVPARRGEREPVRLARWRRRLAKQTDIRVQGASLVTRDGNDP